MLPRTRADIDSCPLPGGATLLWAQVKVQAGVRVQDLADQLKPHGLTLQNYASIREQTIGGFTQVGVILSHILFLHQILNPKLTFHAAHGDHKALLFSCALCLSWHTLLSLGRILLLFWISRGGALLARWVLWLVDRSLNERCNGAYTYTGPSVYDHILAS